MAKAGTARRMAHVVPELWNIRYVHSYGRSGTTLLHRLAQHASPAAPGLTGKVVTFTSMRARDAGRQWTVLACIDFGPYGTIFGRVVGSRPWTPATIRSDMRVGQRVAPSASVPEVRSIADIDFSVVP